MVQINPDPLLYAKENIWGYDVLQMDFLSRQLNGCERMREQYQMVRGRQRQCQDTRLTSQGLIVCTWECIGVLQTMEFLQQLIKPFKLMFIVSSQGFNLLIIRDTFLNDVRHNFLSEIRLRGAASFRKLNSWDLFSTIHVRSTMMTMLVIKTFIWGEFVSHVRF